MKVKTANLKNNLSRYLATIQKTGETIIVCDRDKPVATLSPIIVKNDEGWAAERKAFMEKARKAGLMIEVPVHRPDRSQHVHPVPTVAPDRRTDVSTIDWVRKGREY
jgi:antitoxin (DNA-binding transcriptional repressor) of toxin-antitoxin stability system